MTQSDLCKEGYDIASSLLSHRAGSLLLSESKDQFFRYREAGVCILFYPHKTTRGNYSIRVRDENSKDKPLANIIMDHLIRSTKDHGTFSRHNPHTNENIYESE